MVVEEHWWNGVNIPRGRRDVYICTDGQQWQVQAQIGGAAGRSKIQQCPSRVSASILAGAWRSGGTGWREMPR